MARGERHIGRTASTSLLLVVAALLGGCFQPLYSDRSVTGAPALREALSAVDIRRIDAPPNTPTARLAVQIRNDLQFNFTGGSAPPPATHQLRIQITGSRAVVATSAETGLPIIQNYVLHATYSLVETGTQKTVVTGRATTTVSYNPAGQQRFANVSGMQDAEKRAAKVISDNITTRLASYFVSGT
jgi:LPS-assembly lipoprotein